MDSLVQYLNAIHPLPQEDLDLILPLFTEVEFKRKEFMTREGQTERYLYFVLEGFQRSYYEKDGKEHVIAFTYPSSFSGIPESFLTQTPSRYYLETLTRSRMLRLSYDKMVELYEHSQQIERLMRKSNEMVLVGTAQRYYEQKALSLEERFTVFVNRSAHLLTKIPHKHIASYLGMDPTNFSKLLSKHKL